MKKNTKAYVDKRIFTVRLCRWGDPEQHSYIWGSWSTYEKALEEAEKTMIHRAGKYDAEIYEDVVDSGWCDLYRKIHWGDFKANKYDREDE